MRKITHPNFELELSGLKLSDTEQTHWFSDSIFSKYSLPFDVYLNNETIRLFNFVNKHLVSSAETIFDVMYWHNETANKAIMEIEEIQGDVMTCTIRYGFDEFPNFQKKLSELPLDNFDVPNIYTHAKTIITKSFPEVNYNFPQIHVDKIENPEDDDVWFAFENILNNYKEGEFLENDVDVEKEIIYNRNIMQPLPYLLHVLQKGFEDGGFVLKGSLLSNELFKKTLLYSERDYYRNNIPESVDLGIYAEDEELIVSERFFTAYWTTETTFPGGTIHIHQYEVKHLFRKYTKTVAIPLKGKYRIIGKVVLGKSQKNLLEEIPKCSLYYNNQLIFSTSWNPAVISPAGIPKKHININVEIDTDTTTSTDEIRLEVATTDYDFINDESRFPDTVSDCWVNPIIMHDDSGDVIPTVVNEDIIDLPRAVPDMTFGELVTTLKNWFNLDFVPKGDEIWINFVEEQINFKNTEDLTFSEIKNPKMSFQKGMSFLLKFQEVESKDYSFPPIFHSRNSIVSSEFITDEKTNEININALPLPLAYRKGVLTAHSFEKNQSKPFFVIYDGLINDLNLTQNNTLLQLPNVHAIFWEKWFNFRINSISYQWSFTAFYHHISKIKQKVFAYGNYHIVKTINRTEIEDDLFEVEIETESLK